MKNLNLIIPKEKNLTKIRNKIDKMFVNFESEINNFDNYRKIFKR